MINLRTQSARRDEAVKQDALMRAFERPLADSMARELRSVSAQAASDVEHSHTLHLDSLLSNHKSAVARIIRFNAGMAYRAFAKRTLQALASSRKSLADDDYIESSAQDWLDEHGGEQVTDIAETTIDRIKGALKRGRTSNLSWAKIAQEIERVTGGIIADTRAQIIAQTEMHAAAQAGSLTGATASGIPTNKVWNCTHDDRTRDSHYDADGQSVSSDDAFEVGDSELDYPGDPFGAPEETINCRCVMTYEDPPASKGT